MMITSLSNKIPNAFRQKITFKISLTRRYLSSSIPDDVTSDGGVAPTIINIKRKKGRDGTGQPKGYYEDKYVLESNSNIVKPAFLGSRKPYLVLGIESSCDDTGAAVVRSDGTILSNVIYSQYEIHQKFGGVVPSLAMEAHKSNIDKAVNEAIQQAGLTSVNDIDVISVTKGPGLEVCLRVGLRKAQALAREYNKTFVTVHHLEAHCMTARLGGMLIQADSNDSKTTQSSSSSSSSSSQTSIQIPSPKTPKVSYPFLTLLASGGHTSIVLCHGLGNYTVLGGTLDDALGEAFDKVSRILGLVSDKSGGAAVEAQAEAYFNRNSDKPLPVLKEELNKLNLKLPLIGKPNCDFSYSGLKNAFRMAVTEVRTRRGLQADSTNAPARDNQEVETVVSLPQEDTEYLCAGFQEVAFSHVVDRLKRALLAVERLHLSTPITGLVVVGGVAANKELRRRLLSLLEDIYQNELEIYQYDQDNMTPKLIQQRQSFSAQELKDLVPKKLNLYFPSLSLCTDNGAMVAWTAVEKLSLGISDEVENQEVIPRWPLGRPLSDENLFKKKK